MKYRDLIEKLLPFADEEINMVASHISDGTVTTVEARFFHPGENGELIVGAKQQYNESFDNLGEAKIIEI